MKKLQVMAACISGMIAASSPTARALAINYGTLQDGVPVVDSLTPAQSIHWAIGLDYWRFYGIANENVTITGRRLDGDLDPAFYVFQGQYATTDQIAGLIQNSRQIGWADDELPANPAPSIGHPPGGDPQFTFNLPVTGAYTIGFGSYSSGKIVDSSGLYEYSLTANGIHAFPDLSEFDPTKTAEYNSVTDNSPEVLTFDLNSLNNVPEAGGTFGYLIFGVLGLFAFWPMTKTKLANSVFVPGPTHR